MKNYDVIAIGAGPAGSTAAFKCSSSGFKTLLLELKRLPRTKICGGLLTPACIDLINEEIEKEIPERIKSKPAEIGLYYIPPSGKANGKQVFNYKITNIQRSFFDYWLTELAKQAGAEIIDEAKFISFREKNGNLEISVIIRGQPVVFTTKYLIGADGVFSTIRKQITGTDFKKNIATIFQEWYKATCDIENFFYMFWRDSVTPLCAYAYPKDELFVLGTGVTPESQLTVIESMSKFRDWLKYEFNFKPEKLLKREVWAIPFGYICYGEKNIVLVGDAAGFCNAFSGEGIRPAIESGLIAAESVKLAETTQKELVQVYEKQVNGIAEFVKRVHRFTIELDDEKKEDFVKNASKTVIN